MNNNNDDDLSLDDSFDEFEQKENTLGSLWRDNPFVKIGIIVGAAIAIFALIIFLSGGRAPDTVSEVGAAPDMTSTPGTTEASPAYVQAVEEQNEQMLEQAIAGGTSALPVPIQPPVGVIDTPGDLAPEDDPLQRWRKLQEERLKREIQQSEVVPQNTPQDTGRAEAISQLSSLMAQQMSSVLESQKPNPLNTKRLTDPNYLELLNEQALAEANAGNNGGDQNQIPPEVLLPAGEILYAQLLIEANSDAPGPILAQIMSGPLKGYRVLGAFSVEKELLALNFTSIVIDEETYPINAVALDPNTTLAGLATDVDHHYLKRIILPMASAFITGVASAIEESGRTTVTIAGQSGQTTTEQTGDSTDEQEVASGIDEAGQKLGEILDEMADETEVTVIVAAGTPMGLFFIEPVIKQKPELQQPQQQQQQQFPFGFVPAGAAGGGFPGFVPGQNGFGGFGVPQNPNTAPVQNIQPTGLEPRVNTGIQVP